MAAETSKMDAAPHGEINDMRMSFEQLVRSAPELFESFRKAFSQISTGTEADLPEAEEAMTLADVHGKAKPLVEPDEAPWTA